MTEVKTEVLFNPFPKQIEFLEAIFSDKYDVILYGGAIRGGKTFAGLGAILLLSKMYPSSKWAVVRDSLQTLKRTTIPSFQKICPQSFIKSYNQDTQVVTLTNNSQIIFFSENFADDKELNRWKGLEVNGFLLEEVNELQLKSFYKSIERAGTHIIQAKQPKPKVIATCNPANNWVKELFYDRNKNATLPDRWLYIPSKITDNPFIPKEYLESLKSMPRFEYEVFVNGNWELQQKSGAEFYKEFNVDKHVGVTKYNPDIPLWLSIDENVHPYFTCTVWQIEGKTANQIDEILMRNPNNTVDGMSNEIISKYKGHTSGMLITGDSTSNKQDVKIEKGYNLFKLIAKKLQEFNPVVKTPLSNPSVYMRGQFINTVLFSNYGDIQIVIGQNCKESIKDYANTKQDSDGTKLKTKTKDADSGVRYEEFGHISDAMDYLLTTVFKIDFDKYQRGDNPVTQSMGHNTFNAKTRY